MAEARVKARLWVDMALRLGNAEGRYGSRGLSHLGIGGFRLTR